MGRGGGGGWGGHEKTRYRGGFHKKGSWDSLWIYGGLGKKDGDGAFEGGLIPPCTLCTACKYSFSDFWCFVIWFDHNFAAPLKLTTPAQAPFTCSKLTIETLEQDEKYVQS